MEYIGLYIHIPFCLHRCGYCDFSTFAGLDGLIPAYSEAVCREIELLSSTAPERLHIGSIYFGGGTPSLISADALGKILTTLDENFQLDHCTEISLEANPGTVSATYMGALRALNVNRLSLGMQSANQDELSLLERQHSFDDVVKAVEWSRVAGIMNLNLDLIFGLPRQGMDSWNTSLEAAMALKPEHLSLYALTLEAGTPLQHKVESGLVPEPDPDQAADMYEYASERLAEAGYIQYEISNWARRGIDNEILSCKHNLQYWRNLPYLGIGAGAHGFIGNKRTVNVSSPGSYIKRMKTAQDRCVKNHTFPRTPATVQILPIYVEAEIGETMMMGLRLVMEGVSDKDFQKRFRMSLRTRYGSKIESLISRCLLEWSGEANDTLRLTRRGRLLGNQVFMEFI